MPPEPSAPPAAAPPSVPAGGRLADLLRDAAAGRFPPPDGSRTVTEQPSPRDAGVLALTAHAVVFTDEDPDWVRSVLDRAPGDAFNAALSPYFLSALADRTGRVPGSIDVLSHATALAGRPELELRELDDPGHPRVARALAHRDEVRVWTAEGGVLILGRGVAGRWEAAIEVGDGGRNRGLGRRLADAARRLVPADGVWAQKAPGNAASVRAFQAAGYRPVGAEILFSLKP